MGASLPSWAPTGLCRWWRDTVVVTQLCHLPESLGPWAAHSQAALGRLMVRGSPEPAHSSRGAQEDRSSQLQGAHLCP